MHPFSRLEQPSPLSLEAARGFMEACLDPETEAKAVGQALLAYGRRPFSGTELTAFAEVLGGHARPFPSAIRPLLDTCGTGGDARKGVHTANLSTLSALALAQMEVDIVKHGSRSASSLCGSADLLEALGMDLDRSQDLLAADLERTHFAFLFAPRFHPVLARMAPIRRALGVPTVFNMLGPLLNPARPEFQVLGVAREDWLEPVAQALAAGGLRGGLVVHGLTGDGVGMDEASLEGPTALVPVREGQVLPRMTLLPEDLGVRRGLGGRRADSKEACIDLALGLAGGAGAPGFPEAVAEDVALQAALGLFLVRGLPLARLAREVAQGVAEVRGRLHAGLDLPRLLGGQDAPVPSEASAQPSR